MKARLVTALVLLACGLTDAKFDDTVAVHEAGSPSESEANVEHNARLSLGIEDSGQVRLPPR